MDKLMVHLGEHVFITSITEISSHVCSKKLESCTDGLPLRLWMVEKEVGMEGREFGVRGGVGFNFFSEFGVAITTPLDRICKKKYQHEEGTNDRGNRRNYSKRHQTLCIRTKLCRHESVSDHHRESTTRKFPSKIRRKKEPESLCVHLIRFKFHNLEYTKSTRKTTDRRKDENIYY